MGTGPCICSLHPWAGGGDRPLYLFGRAVSSKTSWRFSDQAVTIPLRAPRPSIFGLNARLDHNLEVRLREAVCCKVRKKCGQVCSGLVAKDPMWGQTPHATLYCSTCGYLIKFQPFPARRNTHNPPSNSLSPCAPCYRRQSPFSEYI